MRVDQPPPAKNLQVLLLLLAVITQVYPLDALVRDSQAIAVMRVEHVEKGYASILTGRGLKGDMPFRRVRFRIASDHAQQDAQLARRLHPERRMVLFFSQYESSGGARDIAIGCLDGTWLRLGREKGQGGWRFVHFEPGLRRTFHGTTDDLERTLADAIAGRKKAPPPDRSIPPGIGPE